jgi:uncharacterized protein (DUF58 family)
MMVPSRRMLWLAAVIALPLTTVAGLIPAALAPCAAVLGICVVAAILDAAAGRDRLRQLGVRLPASLQMTKGVPGKLPVTVENRTRRSRALRLAIVMPAGIEAGREVEEITAPPGLSAIEWKCVGRNRGAHPLARLHLETPSPLGLWEMREPRETTFEFRVYPNLRDRATASLFLKTAPGARMRRMLGKGREFDNLRHYVSGDNFEDIHWKATARRAFPVVKLYRVEHAQEVYAVIDASRLSAREGILESYVEAALHLAIVAERQGDRFGLVTFSDRTQRFVRAHGGMDHFRLCRETIYNLRPERVSPDFREVFTTLQLQLRRRSLIVIFTSLDDALLAETFEHDIPLLARRHLVLVNVTRTAAMNPLFTGEPPADTGAVYERLAGQMLWNRMRTLQIALGHRGVKLTVVDPGQIKTSVTADYLDVKRRQAL